MNARNRHFKQRHTKMTQSTADNNGQVQEQKIPTRPPTERERKDVAIKFLTGLIQNAMLSEEQATVFPELKSVLTRVSDVAKDCLKEVL